jgi:streptogramin lyase
VHFTLPGGTFPGDITAGADGNLWFTQSSGIGRITPDGTYTAFGVGEVTPFAITRGADGNVWFTERFGQRVGKITPGGDFTFYPTELHTLDSIHTCRSGRPLVHVHSAMTASRTSRAMA